MILTTDEKLKLATKYMDAPGTLVNETEAAVIAKLTAGVSVEPVGYLNVIAKFGQDFFTASPADESSKAVYHIYEMQTAIAAARCKAIEECARLIESTELSGMNNDIQLQVFVGRLLIEYCKAIRKLKEST
jgi:hypothetical protein